MCSSWRDRSTRRNTNRWRARERAPDRCRYCPVPVGVLDARLGALFAPAQGDPLQHGRSAHLLNPPSPRSLAIADALTVGRGTHPASRSRPRGVGGGHAASDVDLGFDVAGVRPRHPSPVVHPRAQRASRGYDRPMEPDAEDTSARYRRMEPPVRRDELVESVDVANHPGMPYQPFREQEWLIRHAAG